jgi:LIM domain
LIVGAPSQVGSVIVLMLRSNGTIEAFHKYVAPTDVTYFGRSVVSIGDLTQSGSVYLAVVSGALTAGVRPVWILTLSSTGVVSMITRLTHRSGSPVLVGATFGNSLASFGDGKLLVGEWDYFSGRGAVWLLRVSAHGTVLGFQNVLEADDGRVDSRGFSVAAVCRQGSRSPLLAVGAPGADSPRGEVRLMSLHVDVLGSTCEETTSGKSSTTNLEPTLLPAPSDQEVQDSTLVAGNVLIFVALGAIFIVALCALALWRHRSLFQELFARPKASKRGSASPDISEDVTIDYSADSYESVTATNATTGPWSKASIQELGSHPTIASEAGGKICGQCTRRLSGRTVEVRGARIHGECFVCSHCSTSLFEGGPADHPPNRGYVKQNDRGELLCKHCFELHTRSCDVCGGSLADSAFAEVKLPSGREVLVHRGCLRCARCSGRVRKSFALAASEELVCAECRSPRSFHKM